MPWMPGQHQAARKLEQPYEDVPEHLFGPLWAWIRPQLQSKERTIALAIHFRIPTAAEGSWVHDNAIEALRTAAKDRPTFLLDIIEALLRVGVADPAPLEQALWLGNSIYAVSGGRLELRVLPEVKAQVQDVVNAAEGSPGDHLATAWAEAYGRTADPPKAYSESIKAVEAAAAPIVEPNNAKATLGTILGVLRADLSRWKFDLAPTDDTVVEGVVRMMSLLWTGQTSRHGGVAPTRHETPEEARVAVHLAATLVQFFISGAFAKR